jgi:hypothetical protein
MRRIGIAGALLVAFMGATGVGGCAAAVDLEQLDPEPISSETGEVGLKPASFDPSACTRSATQCNGMHCCPFGEAMTGAHINENTFQCRGIYGATESNCYVDSGTTRVVEGITVKACPVGFYMKGHHANQNRSTCCEYPSWNGSTTVTLDGYGEPPLQATVPYLKDPWPWAGTCKTGSMHVCPGMSVMEGIHVAGNFFLCGM